jgi:hypothetical protein
MFADTALSGTPVQLPPIGNAVSTPAAPKEIIYWNIKTNEIHTNLDKFCTKVTQI